MRQVLGPDGPVVPTFIAGFTDSRFFRERGIPAYGLSPFKLGPDDSKGIHSTDERIPLAEIDRGVERMRRILAVYAAPRPVSRIRRGVTSRARALTIFVMKTLGYNHKSLIFAAVCAALHFWHAACESTPPTTWRDSVMKRRLAGSSRRALR